MEANYVSSMPKLGPTGTKTDHLEFANLQVLEAFLRGELVDVSARIALITRSSSVQINPPQPIEVIVWKAGCSIRPFCFLVRKKDRSTPRPRYQKTEPGAPSIREF
jgi:hypothetical protein